MLNKLRDAVYADAELHGLYDDRMEYPTDNEALLRWNCASRVLDEVYEAEHAYREPAHFAEELADVIITALSVAGKLGVDIDAEVVRKMEINKKRPYGHKGEKHDA